MKKVIKKIAVAAMAFTLLGTGVAFSENQKAPAETIAITAHAAGCQHHGYRYRVGNAVKCGNCDKVVYYICEHHGYRYRSGNAVICGNCGGVVYYL